MGIFAIPDVGKIGVVLDKRPQELPPNAWSLGQNVRFRDGFAEKFLGHDEPMGTPTVAPYFALPVPTPTNYFWLYLGLQKAYAYDGSSHTNVTRQTASVDVNYTGTATDQWNGGVLSGIPIVTNGVDLPQMWLPVGTGTKLAALTNWPASTYCKTIKPFKQFLVAGDITKSGTRYPFMVKWSHPAAPGAVPTSWDETDTTKDAGEYDFAQDAGYVLDTTALRDVNVVYREGSVWGMQYIGSIDIFRFFRMFNSFGALSKNCAVEFVAGKHLVFSTNDILIHDGQSAESILQERVRKAVFAEIDQTNFRNSFVVRINAREEVWCCYPETGQTWATKAVVWNWRTGTVGFRELPGLSFASPGIIQEASTENTWTQSGTWETDSQAWGERLYSPSQENLLLVSPRDTKLFRGDSTNAFNGTAFTSMLERTGLGIPFKQSLPPDITSMKFMRNIWPRFDASFGTTVKVQVGSQMEVGGAVSWQAPQDFIIGQQQKVDCLISGRLLAVRFYSDTAVDWRLHGYEVDVQMGGHW